MYVYEPDRAEIASVLFFGGRRNIGPKLGFKSFRGDHYLS